MAVVTYFLATSPSKKRLTIDEIESLILELLHEEHLFLPAAILVGSARNEVRGEAFYKASKEGNYLRADQYIIPNAPGSMVALATDTIEEQKPAPETLWYYGDDEAAFIDALRSVPLRERDICFCFPYLSDYLVDSCDWDWGAALYALTQPLPIDFIDAFYATPAPLIDYNASDFFALSSSVGGLFPDFRNNPLKPILQRAFGPDLDMEQTIGYEARKAQKKDHA